MKRFDKVLWLLLLVGLVGTIVTVGVVVGGHMLWQYEVTKEFPLQSPVTSAKLDTLGAAVELIPSDKDFRVEVYATAWLEKPLVLDDILSVTQQGSEVTITQTAFPQRFLGMFPQPYGLNLKLYLPQQVCDTLKGELK